MTRAKFIKQEGNYVALLCEGHTGFAVQGKDIVCAAISTAVGALRLGLTQVLNIKCKVVQDDRRGYMEIRLPQDVSKLDMASAQVLFSTALVTLLDLQEGYPDSINVEV